MNLENSVDPWRIAQALVSSNYAKKSIITVKVTTVFFATLFKSISCTLHPRPTEFSRMKRFYAQKLILIALCSIGLSAVIHAAPEQAAVASSSTSLLYPKGYKHTFISIGAYTGIDENKAVDIKNISYGRGYYLTDGLGLYGEVLVMAARGERKTVDADNEGMGAFFSLRWHFIRFEHWSVFLNHGIGPVVFFEEFPPGGTKLNGLIQYGLGMSAHVGKSTTFQLGLRHIHISNGKGMVDDNPSYDGRGAYLAIEQQF